MGEQRVKRVVIAGGGTAGWIAAAGLAKQLGKLIDITLVESDEIGTVGVGESTIPTTRAFHTLMGIDEREFIRATQATFKLGIAFEDWGQLGDRYIHSFGTVGKSTWMADFQHFWLHARARGIAGDFGDYCLELQAAEAGKFATSQEASINYAYHLDATLYGRFLRTIAQDLGVRRIEGRINAVRQDPESGYIGALMLASGEEVTGDLFIDCTGFRGLLIEQTLKTGYEDWAHWLPTNSALAVQTRSIAPALPYTRAIAHRSGWQWRIPLQHRVGNGLVYASDYMSDDEARALLAARVQGEMLGEPRLIRYRTGRRHKAWEKNCIALGLSAGFVEPLESTSIHLIMIGVTRLIQAFPFGGIRAAQVDRFNAQSRAELAGIRDFIILHYHASDRDDSDFWRRTRGMDVPESLAERIELFREGAQAYQASDDLFRVDSWVQVLLGQHVRPDGYHPVARLMPEPQLRDALASLKTNIKRAVSELPMHHEFLRRYAPAIPQ